MSEDIKKLYDVRFSEEERKKKREIWKEICKYINRKLGSESGIIVDVAAGYCDFINNYYCADAQLYAIDLNPDVKIYANDNVEALCGGIEKLEEYFEINTVALFFMSNFLEHITKDEIRKMFESEYRLLKQGGKLLILTPNIKYVGGKFWDYFDHITPITDNAIIELAESMGYKLVKNISRFMPYTTKSKLPQSKWIVALYLKLMPFSGWLCGEQSLIMFEKE